MCDVIFCFFFRVFLLPWSYHSAQLFYFFFLDQEVFFLFLDLYVK